MQSMNFSLSTNTRTRQTRQTQYFFNNFLFIDFLFSNKYICSLAPSLSFSLIGVLIYLALPSLFIDHHSLVNNSLLNKRKKNVFQGHSFEVQLWHPETRCQHSLILRGNTWSVRNHRIFIPCTESESSRFFLSPDLGGCKKKTGEGRRESST